MSLKASEISHILKSQIKNYERQMISEDVGTVITVGDGIALVYGLDHAMVGELLIFPGDIYGMALNLEEDYVGVVLMGSDAHIKEGDEVRRTKQVIEVPVGDGLIGRVVNALGQPIDGKGAIQYDKTRPVERVAPGVMTRQSVNQPLQTGIKSIDAMIPIGRGQRELIIGDRETGKTAIAVDTILNQKDQNVYCIYVAIGQKNSTVAQIAEQFRKAGALAYTTIVSATASELAPLQYLAPYTGCAIGEEWMSSGKDVLIVYDDLSKHAVAYRTMSLLLKRPPGREAYPGDVFYLHSRLLERAAKLNKEHGGGSMTALPIIETLAGDISAYIPTNVISITDGQIFLQTELFNSGFRPALDTGLSVSRVGSTAQIKAMKQVSNTLKLELAQYQELQAFAQFGSDLDATTKAILNHGERVMEILKQDQYQPFDVIDEVLSLFTVKYRMIDKVPIEEVKRYETELISYIKLEYNDLYIQLRNDQAINDELEKQLIEAINRFTERFIEALDV